MTLIQIVDRLVAVGFQFSLAEDGDVSFTCPTGDTPEVDEMKGLIAWRWSELEDAVREHLTPQPENVQ